MDRRSVLANTVPAGMFTVFVVAAAWIAHAGLWWLALALVVVAAVVALVSWRKLGWHPDRLE